MTPQMNGIPRSYAGIILNRMPFLARTTIIEWEWEWDGGGGGKDIARSTVNWFWIMAYSDGRATVSPCQKEMKVALYGVKLTNGESIILLYNTHY